MRYAAIRHVLAGGLNCSALTSISPSTKYKKGSTIEYGEPKINVRYKYSFVINDLHPIVVGHRPFLAMATSW
jgi:hypothetical protein